jgi:hypothetical protein
MAAFGQFLKKGALLEWCELLRGIFGAQELLKCVHDLLTPFGTSRVVAQRQHQPHITGDATPHDATPHDATPHDATPHDATPHDATPHDATPHDATPHDADTNVEPHQNAEEYFRERFPEYKDYRIQMLVRAAGTIAKFTDVQVLPASENVDTSKDPGPRDPITQAIAMFHAIKKLSHRRYLLYFADAVERHILSDSSDKSGHTKKTAAFDRMFELTQAPKPEVAQMDLAGNKCLECMRIGGAASLYSIECSKNE